VREGVVVLCCDVTRERTPEPSICRKLLDTTKGPTPLPVIHKRKAVALGVLEQRPAPEWHIDWLLHAEVLKSYERLASVRKAVLAA
jgi:hypothetical protein